MQIAMITNTIITTIAIILGLLPLAFLPLTNNPADTPKLLIWVTLATFGIGLSLIRLWREKTVHFPLYIIMLASLLMALATVLTLLFGSANRVEALLTSVGPVVFISFALLLAFIPELVETKYRRLIRQSLTVAIAILSLIVLGQLTQVSLWLPRILPFLADPLWNPTGSATAALGINLISLLFILPVVTRRGYLGLLVLIIITSGLIIFKHSPIFSSYNLLLQDNLSFTQSLLAHPQSLWFGVGAENSPTSINFLMYWIMTHGISGSILFMIFLLLILANSNSLRERIQKLLISFLLLIFPPNLGFLGMVLVSYIICSSSPPSRTLSFTLPIYGKIFLSLIGLVFMGATTMAVVRAYMAELLYYQSFQAAKASDGTRTYDLQIATISWNPYPSKYHIGYSQTNLTLAETLTKNLSGELENSTPRTEEEKKADRELAASLVQQAVREAKLAVTLAPKSIPAWENLASAYEALSPVTHGADNWALAALTKLTQLDGNNPDYWASLGKTYAQQNKWPEARANLLKALSLSPNHLLALYNLSYVAEQTGDFGMAIMYAESTLKKLDPGSSDFHQLLLHLEKLRKKLQ